MEELTKQQIVLVTLLVSFVTSIATGIVTVALMDQAPPGVTQTINRVVERTIEKVTPVPTEQQASVITKETIVVKEDDLVVKAIEQNTKSVVSIFSVVGEGDSQKSIFLGNGLIVNKDGLIAIDASLVVPSYDDEGLPIASTIVAQLSEGTNVPLASASNTALDTGLKFMKADNVATPKGATFTPAIFAPVTSFKLGQTVIALGGDRLTVATGIISNLSQKKTSGEVVSTTTPAQTPLQIVTTDIRGVGKSTGSILVNLSGEVIGIRLLSAGGADNAFLSANAIGSLLSKMTESTATTN
ncbi:MAG: serine protease [Candidatus Taylorbacteria bacterium]|nr:serine protease [Candidatus Taylorbacteria bacterium]